MKNNTFKTLNLAAAFCLFSLPALAHQQHCHIKGVNGALVDYPEATDKKSCEAKKGKWKHHHLHCHKQDEAGKMVDFKEGKTEKSCESKGGKWTDHAHEAGG